MNYQIAKKCVKKFYQRELPLSVFRGFNKTVQLFEIRDKRAFFAQCCYESGGFSAAEENLNYSAEALRRVFGRYFKTHKEAQRYARKPVQIACRVYGRRMGNGRHKFYGWLFRGRGWIQLTGFFNYLEMSKVFGKHIIDYPDQLSQSPYAWYASGFYWTKHNLNKIKDFKELTRKINGGYNGLRTRKRIYNYLNAA